MGGRLAILAATSGHSGVDRIVANLVPQLDAWGVAVDLLRVRGHGPALDTETLAGVRLVDLGASHVTAVLPALVGYLRRERPTALLADKDRVNRVAILARALARVETRLGVRLGTAVSANLASRGALERRLQRLSMRYLYPLADSVLVPSLGVADDLAAYTGLPRGHIQVVPSPIVTPTLARLAAEPPDHPWLAGDGPPVILGVGEIGSRKDFATLIRAFALVRRERPCRLIVLGRGRQRAALLGLAARLGVGADLDLPGFAPNPYAYMARAGAFALSSRWEGFGIVLVEALACGTPVVSTDCPHGPREILADGRYGRLVPVGDAGAMAAALLATLAGGRDTERLRGRAREFSVERSAAAYLEALGMGGHALGKDTEAICRDAAP